MTTDTRGQSQDIGMAGQSGAMAGGTAGAAGGAVAGGITGWGVGMVGGGLMGLVAGMFLGIALSNSKNGHGD